MNPRTTERSRTRGVSFLQTVGLSHIYLDAHPAETEGNQISVRWDGGGAAFAYFDELLSNHIWRSN